MFVRDQGIRTIKMVVFSDLTTTVAFIVSLVLIPTSSDGFPMQFSSEIPADRTRGLGCNSVTNCTLSLSPENARKFRDLIEKHHALAVFMFLTIGNETNPVDTMDSDSNGKVIPYSVQLREKWAWTRGKRGRFLATLPYDFDILSLTTLTRDVYDLSLTMNATPPECFANISRVCTENIVARSLMEDVTEAKAGNVCLKILDRETALKKEGYLCCEKLSNGTVLCNNPIESNEWISFAVDLLWVLSLMLGLFAPLLFKYLPKEFKKGPRKAKGGWSRQGSESQLNEGPDVRAKVSRQHLMAKDDGIIDILRGRTESVLLSRFCRCLLVVLISCLPVLQAALYWYLKQEEVGISQQLLGVGDAFITLVEPGGKYALATSFCFCVLLLCIAIAIPKSLSDLARQLSGRKDERSILGFRKPTELVCSSDKRGFQLLYENMIFHLTCVMSFKFWKFMFLVATYPLQKVCGLTPFDVDDSIVEEDSERENLGRCLTILKIIVLILVFPFWAVTVLSAFILYVIPATYVAFRIWKMLFRVEIECKCCNIIPLCCKITAFPLLYIFFIVFCILVEASYFMLAITLTFNVMFLGSVGGFTILGLLFYIQFYIPYIMLGFWIVVFILRGFHKYHAQFVNLKNVIFEECENYDVSIKTAEANIRESFRGPESKSASTSSLTRTKSVLFLVFPDEFGLPSIPLELFLLAFNQMLPFKRIILAKLLKVIAICSYLTVVFSFVMSLKEFDAASPVLQALAILFLGGLPLLVRQKEKDVADTEEQRLRFRIKEVINDYCKRFS